MPITARMKIADIKAAHRNCAHCDGHMNAPNAPAASIEVTT
jgi:hypothetical protein